MTAVPRSLTLRLKDLGFAQGNQMKLYGENFEVASEPMVLTGDLVLVDLLQDGQRRLARQRVQLAGQVVEHDDDPPRAHFQRPFPSRYWNRSCVNAEAGSASLPASENVTVANMLGLFGLDVKCVRVGGMRSVAHHSARAISGAAWGVSAGSYPPPPLVTSVDHGSKPRSTTRPG